VGVSTAEGGAERIEKRKEKRKKEERRRKIQGEDRRN
jgi:hypothetical protein